MCVGEEGVDPAPGVTSPPQPPLCIDTSPRQMGGRSSRNPRLSSSFDLTQHKNTLRAGDSLSVGFSLINVMHVGIQFGVRPKPRNIHHLDPLCSCVIKGVFKTIPETQVNNLLMDIPCSFRSLIFITLQARTTVPPWDVIKNKRLITTHK